MISPILAAADDIIHGERAEAYGPAEDSFARIAQFWTDWLGSRLADGLDAYDVAMMMTLMKVSRAATDTRDDTFVDISGYAALAPRCAKAAGRS